MTSARLPSRFLLSCYVAGGVSFYLLLYFVFRSFIDEKYLRDAIHLQELATFGGASGGAVDESYANTAAVFSFFPFQVTTLLVGLLNAFVLACLLRTAKTWRMMVLLSVFLVPFAVLNLMAPNKETLVMTMALGFAVLAAHLRRPLFFLLWVAGFYTLYALFFRSYYFLILAAFFFFLLWGALAPFGRAFVALVGLVVFLSLPRSLFETLQAARDLSNGLGTVTGTIMVRTFFFNLYPPDGPWHFFLNYLYAFFKLHLPFLSFLTVNELMLFAAELFFAWLLWGLRKARAPQRWLGALFAAHIAVLVLFEPDFGSYFRHFSCLFPMLIPALNLREQEALAVRGAA